MRMARPLTSAVSIGLVAAIAGLAGCGGSSQQAQDGGDQDADFVQCAMSPAVDYAPGIVATSMAGAYVATLDSARTFFSDGSSVDGAVSGSDTWVLTVTDAVAGTPADVTMTAEKPWMPKHGHGATSFPMVAAGDPGMFTVSGMILFMTGYWSAVFDLQPASGAADKVTFAICIRQ
jgi:hypothetical protein